MNPDILVQTVSFIQSRISTKPTIAVVLGSGLGDFAEQLSKPVTINTSDIPNYPVSTVPGHAGKIHFGALEINGRKSSELVVFQGRVHFYESNNLQRVVFPIHVAKALGVEILLVTNAAGGINGSFDSGTLMFINDHLNLTCENPLVGKKIESESTSMYSRDLLSSAKKISAEHHIKTKEGVYCWTKGPSYESASEIKMMALLGADAVGMSTVPEVIVANHLGMKVLGISCITNMATGISLTKLSHEEVNETANRVKDDFTRLVREIVFSMQ